MNDSDAAAIAGERAMLRHALATLAYRAAKAIRGAPAGFGDTRASDHTRSAGEIISHIADLLEWSAALATGRSAYNEHPAASWHEDVDRFFKNIVELDSILRSASGAPVEPRRIFQGPIADALTHVVQLNVLWRIAGAPIRGENYWLADIEIGRVGVEQSPPNREFD